MVEEGEDYERRASFLLEEVVDEVQREEEVVDEAQREQEGYLEFQVEGRLGQIQESQEREIGRGMVGGAPRGGVVCVSASVVTGCSDTWKSPLLDRIAWTTTRSPLAMLNDARVSTLNKNLNIGFWLGLLLDKTFVSFVSSRHEKKTVG